MFSRNESGMMELRAKDAVAAAEADVNAARAADLN